MRLYKENHLFLMHTSPMVVFHAAWSLITMSFRSSSSTLYGHLPHPHSHSPPSSLSQSSSLIHFPLHKTHHCHAWWFEPRGQKHTGDLKIYFHRHHRSTTDESPALPCPEQRGGGGGCHTHKNTWKPTLDQKAQQAKKRRNGRKGTSRGKQFMVEKEKKSERPSS